MDPSSTDMSSNTSPSDKTARLLVRAYIITVALAVLIVILAIMVLSEPHTCSAMSRALTVLWTTIAALFLASIFVVGVVAWRIIPSVQQRRAIVVVYAIMMLVSYALIAFGLLVAFNC